ncbi:hypothetical protein DSECCO2_19210 [anaerobic digester metagenome]
MSELRDLLAVILFVLAAAAVILVPPLSETPLRAILGFPLIFFVPGYVFIEALFPEREELTGIERLTLGIGLSICIAVFIGFGLNYTPWGIRPGSILLALAGFTLAFTAAATIRRMRCRAGEGVHRPEEGGL